MSLVLRNKGKGMQRSSEQPLVGEERYVTTLITAAKETILSTALREPYSYVLHVSFIIMYLHPALISSDSE